MVKKEFDWDDEKHIVQEWLIGYKDKTWYTVNLPGLLSINTVEKVIHELNKEHDIIVSRKIMGVLEPNRNYTKKGEFMGLW